MTTFKHAVGIDADEELMKILSDEIAREIDERILEGIQGGMLISQGWHKVTVIGNKKISSDWFKSNIRGPYKAFGRIVYFKESADAMWFGLTWS